MKTNPAFASSSVDRLLDGAGRMIAAWKKRRVPVKCGTLSLLLSIGLVSCSSVSTQSHGSRKASQPVRVSTHWEKVRSNPPTYYPRGTSRDVPTDFHNGEWVLTHHSDGKRFFVPFKVGNDVSRQTLLQEAMAILGPDPYRPDAGEQSVKLLKVAGNMVVAPPLLLMALYGSQCYPNQEFSMNRNTFTPFDP